MPRFYMQVWKPGTERKASSWQLAQYFVCDEVRKLTSYCKHESWVLKLGKLFSHTLGFVSGRQNR